MSQIRVTRDDTGQEFTDEHLTALLRSIPGVTAVRIEGCDDEGETFRKSWIDAGSIPMGEPAVSGALGRGLMFASVKQSDVDAYVNRQAERMGHTEIHRG